MVKLTQDDIRSIEIAYHANLKAAVEIVIHTKTDVPFTSDAEVTKRVLAVQSELMEAFQKFRNEAINPVETISHTVSGSNSVKVEMTNVCDCASSGWKPGLNVVKNEGSADTHITIASAPVKYANSPLISVPGKKELAEAQVKTINSQAAYDVLIPKVKASKNLSNEDKARLISIADDRVKEI